MDWEYLHPLVGKSPYDGDTNTFSIQTKIVSDPFPLASKIYPGVSKKLERIIFKSTQKDKKDRYNSCEAFKNDLELTKDRFSQSENVIPKNTKGNKKIILTSILLLLFSLAVTYVFVNHSDQIIKKSSDWSGGLISLDQTTEEAWENTKNWWKKLY